MLTSVRALHAVHACLCVCSRHDSLRSVFATYQVGSLMVGFQLYEITCALFLEPRRVCSHPARYVRIDVQDTTN